MKIVMDSNGLCHMAKHSMGSLSYEDQGNTGIIFGFLRQLLKLSFQYKSNQFLFAWDSTDSLRKKIYPDYKSNRRKEKTAEEQEADNAAYAQFTVLKETVLPAIGFKNIFEAKGFEADDVIAKLVSDGNDYVIVSSDEDLFQLLSSNVKIYNPHKKLEISVDSFSEEYGIEPSFWVDVKAIAGCSSDNVKGIFGVGEKTAIKYLRNELKKSVASYAKIFSPEGRKIIRENKKLVTLPFSGCPDFSIQEERLSLNAFLTICQRYGFNSFLHPTEVNKWEKGLQLYDGR